MTLQEIENQFDQEWVLLKDPKTTKSLELKSGKLLYHSKNRDEVYRKAIKLQPKHSAVFFVGKPPDDVVIIL